MKLKPLFILVMMLAFTVNANAAYKSAYVTKVISDTQIELNVERPDKVKPGVLGHVWHALNDDDSPRIMGRVQITELNGNTAIAKVLQTKEPIKDGYNVTWAKNSDREYKAALKAMKFGDFQSASYRYIAVSILSPETKANMDKKLVESLNGMKAVQAMTEAATATNRDKKFLVDEQAFEFVRVPAGSFTMGRKDRAAETPHKVAITKDFYIGKYEITQEQWKFIMGTPVNMYLDKDGKSKFWNMRGEGKLHPAYFISWDMAQEFCKKLSDMTGDTYRLPTEAEWEYANRAGTDTPFFWGNYDSSGSAFAWYYSNSNKSAQGIGLKTPNAWGIHDMNGNVWEMVSDWYNSEYYLNSPANDPQGPETGTHRGMRGGCWENRVFIFPSSRKTLKTTQSRFYDVGFRIVREIK